MLVRQPKNIDKELHILYFLLIVAMAEIIAGSLPTYYGFGDEVTSSPSPMFIYFYKKKFCPAFLHLIGCAFIYFLIPPLFRGYGRNE